MRTWRKIESGIITSERLAKVSDSARWLFVLLLVAQDDEGKYPWTPTMVRSLTVGTTWDTPGTESLLSELRVAGVAELSEGMVVLRHGAEKNGTPANSKKYIMLYPLGTDPGTDSLTSRERVASESLTIVQSRVDKSRVEERREEETPPFEIPPEFEPLTSLAGYKHRNHKQAFKNIAAACAESGVDVAEVVALFATEYPVLRHQFGWADPVAVLKGKPLMVTISKVLSGNNGSRPQRRGDGRPRSFEGHVIPDMSAYLDTATCPTCASFKDGQREHPCPSHGVVDAATGEILDGKPTG